VSDWLSTS